MDKFKSIKLIGSDNRLYKARVDENDDTFVKLDGKWIHANLTGLTFRNVKTKTIKCTWVNHSMQIKKTFKADKRYQIEKGRVLGAVAGYVFDENGDRFTLYREEVGFSAAGGAYLFEAKYS